MPSTEPDPRDELRVLAAALVVALVATAALTVLMFFFAELPLALARQLAGG